MEKTSVKPKVSHNCDTFVKVAFEGELPTPTHLPDKSLFKVELH